MNKAVARVAVSTIIAASIWYVIFIIKPLNFWLDMCVGILLLMLTTIAFAKAVFKIGKPSWRHVLIGIISAAVLYGIFFIGNAVSGVIFPFKNAEINSVYMNGSGTNPFVIGAALLFIIGPGEELFWRGYIQKILLEKFGIKSIFIAALLYTAVHIVTLNFMLIMAALVCGLFWGALYYKEKNIYPVIISHALWDVTVFLMLPFNSTK